MKVAIAAALLALIPGSLQSPQPTAGVAILQVDTDRRIGTIDRKIYGQFLEHINHSVEDGLFAEQIRGAGFEGRDFETYWNAFGPPDAVHVVETPFERGTKSVRIAVGREVAGIRQRRIFLESGRSYDGSVWIKVEAGAPRLSLRVVAADGERPGRTSARVARTGLERSAVFVREPREPIATPRWKSRPPDAAWRSSTSCR